MNQPTSDRLSLKCVGCGAKVRAARELLGRVCPCPRCREPITVRVPLPSDGDIVLVDLNAAG